MQPVYIDCHGFNQLTKVSYALQGLLKHTDLNGNTNKKHYGIGVISVDSLISDNNIYRITIPVYFSHQVRDLHEFLMDYMPIPARFITCEDYEEIDYESSENTMVNHTSDW